MTPGTDSSTFWQNDLCNDEDLTNWESKMPALAQRVGVYLGKRYLAQVYIAKQLLKRGINPATLFDPNQLAEAAVFKELELMFRDMSDKTDGIAAQKADYYSKLFDEELELVILTLANADNTAGEQVKPTISSIPLFRA